MEGKVFWRLMQKYIQKMSSYSKVNSAFKRLASISTIHEQKVFIFNQNDGIYIFIFKY